ncbi:sex-lethal homolog [Drosophila grimshawi]|uniref:sex-lethal homolog n=1 Tax=Drosophila grimshawi TaxID=7222 RepID=UPI001C931EF4|nr:sex-lethal homolog [Drosophila grimshawi]
MPYKRKARMSYKTMRDENIVESQDSDENDALDATGDGVEGNPTNDNNSSSDDSENDDGDAEGDDGGGEADQGRDSAEAYGKPESPHYAESSEDDVKPELPHYTGGNNGNADNNTDNNFVGYADNQFEGNQPQQQQQQQQQKQQQQQQQHHPNQEDPGGGGGYAPDTQESACPTSNSEDRTSATNLIINYLPQNMTDRELFNLFSSCGSINTCKIMRDYKTGYSFGYGFVDYNDETDSEAAIHKFNGLLVRNKRLKVSYARPGGQSIKDTNLYVINLSRNINDDQLDRIFSPFGLIVQRNILRDKLTGRPRGVAFVRYNKREEAQEAIMALNNTVPEGASSPIWVRLAEEHGKAKAAQFMPQVGGGGGGPHMGQQQQQPPPPHHHQMIPHMQLAPRPTQHPRHQQQHQHQMHHQHQQQQKQQHNPYHHHSLPPPPPHMQQLHHHPHGGGGRIGVGVGLPQPMHGGGSGGGGGGGYHPNMANRGRSNRTTRSQKPHPYTNNVQKFI